MKKIYFIPGPSELYPTTISHFQNGFKDKIASISHRSKQFQEIFTDLTVGLKKLLTIPDDYHIFIVGSANEAMERTIQNCVGKYSWHFVNGSFSKRFFTMAQELGKKPAMVEVPDGRGFDLRKMSIPEKVELLCFTQNETSTGVMIPAEKIAKVAKKYPNKLIAVDTVSSAPYVDLDYAMLDVVFFSVQKLFGLPAGLGVMIVSPRAIKKSQQLFKKGMSIGSYHSFLMLLQSAQKQQTPETPPVLEMYVLGKVVSDMQKFGITKMRKEIEQKARLLYDLLDNSDVFSAFVKEKQFRSSTTIVIDITKAKMDIKELLAEKGFVVLGGYGANKDTQVRIANYPAHSIQDVKRLINVLKTV